MSRLSNEEVKLFSDELMRMVRLAEMNKELIDILGPNHGFSIEILSQGPISKLYFIRLVLNGEPVHVDFSNSRGSLLAQTFEEFVMSALKKIERKKSGNRWSTSPSNQLKPFLTPLQEVGINEQS